MIIQSTNHKQAFVLVSMLILCSILTALLSYMLNSTMLQQQINHNYYNLVKIRNAAYYGLNKAYNSKNINCFSKTLYNDQAILNFNTQQWQHNTNICQIHFDGIVISYFYQLVQETTTLKYLQVFSHASKANINITAQGFFSENKSKKSQQHTWLSASILQDDF